jgi:Yip1 domain
MANTQSPHRPQPPRRWHFELVWPILRHPRRVLPAVASSPQALWLTPLVVLTALALLQVVVAVPMRQAAAASTMVDLPMDYQYLTPEQQAQFQASLSASSGPMFTAVFPALGALLRVWLGWLIAAAVLHLVLTLFGARATMGSVFNRVGWASLPFAVQSAVRIVALVLSRKLIAAPGLSGFGPMGEGFGAALATNLLGQVDLFLVWFVVLLALSLRAHEDPGPAKAWGSVLVTLLVVLFLTALPGALAAQLGGLTVIRPFLF